MRNTAIIYDPERDLEMIVTVPRGLFEGDTKQRCETCGRTVACACGPECEHCDGLGRAL
jgi:hypothetical protein